MPDPIVLLDEYDPVMCLAWSPSGRLLAAGTHGGRILLWEGGGSGFRIVHDVQESPAPELAGKALLSVVVQDAVLFIGYEDQVWSLALGSERGWRKFAGVGGPLDLSPQGGRLLIGFTHAVDAGMQGTKPRELHEDAKVTAATLVDDRVVMRASHEDEDNLSINPYGHYEHTGGSLTRWISWLDTVSLESGGDDAEVDSA